MAPPQPTAAGGAAAPAAAQQALPTAADRARALEYFDHLLNATTLKTVLGYHRQMCELLGARPAPLPAFYPRLRAGLESSWRAKALLKKLDARAAHRCYGKARACAGRRVLVVGAGPCGLRAAVEAQLLGAKVVVVEKRDRFSRNNVLHLWPFVIEDLRALGAKKFFGRFCAGAIDHISIRQLQCILLKAALLLGVEVHAEVGFEGLVEPDPDQKTGWRGKFSPEDHPISQYEFDVVLGADGKRNTLEGFKRKEFRGKLAIAITANFINKKTEAEARVEEISGVAFIFNQKFFKDLQEETRIDLENIVYYKDDTHYFVMTAKKASLLEKGVIKQDLADTEKLLAPDNVDREALQNYAREAADFSTDYQMPDLEFAVNHYGQPDVAMFDFTSMYAAEYASKVLERNGQRLLMILVGDSLLEPFWPTGSGCARGFLSSLDAAWAIRSWSLGTLTPLDVLAERESIYRLLAQTTPDNLNKDWKSYTLDPATRYPNLNKSVVLPTQTVCLFDTDNPSNIEKMKRASHEVVPHDVPKKRRRGNVDNVVLLSWLAEQLTKYEEITITDLSSVYKTGKPLCAIIHHYRPDLLDYESIKDEEAAKNNQLAFEVFEKELGIVPIMTGEDSVATEDYLTMASYLTQIYDTFRGEIPHIKHPKLELPESNKRSENSLKTLKTVQPSVPLVASVSRPSSRHKRHVDAIPPKPYSVEKKTRKKRTLDRLGSSVEDRQKVLEEIASNRADRQNKRRQQRKYQTEQFYKSMQMLQANAKDDESQPFEDYSIFLYRQTAPKFEDRVKDWEKQFVYVPDHESKSNVQRERRGSTAADEDIAAKIKNLENKWSNPTPVEKKPKDLLRAIGKIDNSDWNIKEIEKKIMENKLGKPSSQNRDKEKVPKWSKEQFLARQTKMEGRHLDRQDSTEAKYADIDKNIKYLDMKLKEGTARDLGQNKVASITEKLTSKVPNEPKLVEKTVQKAAALPAQNAASEFCHFCGKRVYLMERLSAEGRFFHHGCFKCQYCHSQLRLGSYSFDRDGTLGYKFFCVHHYGMQGEVPKGKVPRKPPHRKSPVKKALPGVSGVDLLDRVQTPERIEFANLSNVSSDHDEPLSQMDEDEWTDKNFGPSCAELDDSDEDTSSVSDTDSDDEGAYDDALEEPATKEGTMKWAERWKNSYSRKHRGSESDGYSSSDRSSYYENTSDDSDSDTATEGEEEIRQRELRRQEVRVEPPVVQTDTGTETEIVSDETTSESSSEIQNSATEISTDSEFAQDEPTPTREAPPVVFDDFHVTKTRGCGGRPRKIQVTAGYIQKGKSTKAPRPDIELKLRPLVPPTPVRKAAPFEGYALNRTQSTGGIAAKVSLELKKKYLLGENSAGSIQKSGSASALDNKFKSFQSTISDCQKLLKPASEIGPGMQAFCRRSPMLSPQSELPPPDVTITTITENKEEKIEPTVFQNEPEGRPRSPVHETSIAVPEIDWGKNKNQSSDSLSLSSSENEVATTPNFHIPRVEVTEDNIAPDSLVIIEEEAKAIESRVSNHSSANSDAPKSISSEKKTLNQPKALPMVENALPEIHKELHVKKDESPENENKSIKTSSGRSSPEMTAALTETETSDWARDAAVSEDDLELDLGDERMRIKDDNIAKIAELDDDFSNTCPIAKEENKTILTVAMTSLLSDNLDSIEFMDTGTETSSDGVVDSQNGYVLFKNEDDMAEDSLDPDINEAKNENVETKFENTGFCVIADETNRFGSEVIDIKPSDLEKMKRKQQLIVEHDEDSLLVIEKDTTTTEDNTCSDSTVKNVTEIAPDTKLSEQLHKQRLEKKLSDLKEQKINEASQTTQKTQSEEFEKHCQRLESKVDFGNAKDSIDVRKSRRKSKSDAPQKPDLIQEESNSPVNKTKDVTLDLSPVIRTPDILYKKENIKKERDINQKLIQEMVLNKMKAENKSLERKKRIRSPYEVSKSSATDLSAKTPQNRPVSLFATPDLLSNSIPLQNSQSAVTVPEKHTPVRPLSVFATDTKKYPETTLSSLENGSMPDLRMNLFAEDFKTPVAPPRQNRSSDVNKTAEKMKEHARARVRLLSNEDLGLSPEDKLLKLREKVRKGKENEKVDPHIQESIESLVLNTERRNSILYSNDTLTKKKKNSSFRRSKSGDSAAPKLSAFDDDIARTKSISEIAKMPQVKGAKLVCKSDPNLLDTDAVKPKKKSKDRERRKSITKLIANIFTKKSPTNGTRGIFSKFSPKTKEISKSCVNLGSRGAEPTLEQQIRRKSFSELSIQKGENTPPPIPPLPANYIGSSINHTDDSSDGEHHWRNREHGSCDTLDRSGALDHSTMSSTGRRTSKSARKAARQAQLKRHRMAQEIQRKLEETEVKTKELEQRGVAVEKALRGEDSGEGSQDEPGLLQEWFDLMRDRSELRRYEKELMVRAQELELEDRHARLQHELRDRLETNESKTERDIEIEERIINEMMEIVSKRDTLLSILEEDKLRYSNEDRDLEEQMLAKGLRLTPIVKTPEK